MNDGLRKKKILCMIMIWLIAVFIPLYWRHEPARQKAATARISRESATRGAQIFASRCIACHRMAGDGIPGKNLRQTSLDETGLVKTISGGRPGTIMMPFGDQNGGPLKTFEVIDVAHFVHNWDQSSLDSAAAALK